MDDGRDAHDADMKRPMEAMLVIFGVGFCGLWWVGVSIAMIKNYKGFADWRTKQPDVWRFGPRIDRPIDEKRAKLTRIKGFACLAFGVMCVAVSAAGSVKLLLQR